MTKEVTDLMKLTRNAGPKKNSKNHNANHNVDIFIERLKKIRALNGDPSLVGMDNYVLKRTRFDSGLKEILIDFWNRT